jgi:hypothetical protein
VSATRGRLGVHRRRGSPPKVPRVVSAWSHAGTSAAVAGTPAAG